MVKNKLFEFAEGKADAVENPMGSSAVNDFYLSADMNCAESIIHAANTIYSLGIDDQVLRTASGFGGGMGVGHLCGAVSDCIMAAGMLFVRERAHESDVLQIITAEFIERVEKHFNSLLCNDIQKSYYQEESGCSQVVYEIAELFWDLVLEYDSKRVR